MDELLTTISLIRERSYIVVVVVVVVGSKKST